MYDAVAKVTEAEKLPFPYNKSTFCLYEPIEKKIEHAKVLIVNDLLRYESDLSELAFKDWNSGVETKLEFERKVSAMACNNIANNVIRLVRNPKTMTVHLSEIANAAEQFCPDAIVMSGTFADFDYYNPRHIWRPLRSSFTRRKFPFSRSAVRTNWSEWPSGRSSRRSTTSSSRPAVTTGSIEYQYRFVKIVDKSDPIFEGNDDQRSGIWQEYTKQDDILRVWQNHGVQVDGLPAGFKLLATSYLCKNQMMVKRTDGQLIYCVQFHLEKSFEDWSKNPTRWEHPNESRDGRILFENFLKLALDHAFEKLA